MRRAAESKPKARGLHALFFIFSIVLILFCIRWQILNSESFKEIAAGRVYSSELDSLRGTIYSNDGTTLAYSEPRYDMFIWYEGLDYAESQGDQTRQEFVDKVAPLIGMKAEDLDKLIKDSKDQNVLWISVVRSLTVDQWNKLNALTSNENGKQLQGIQFEYTSTRVYPEGQLAANLLGLTSSDLTRQIGQGGLEEAWDGNLSPQKGLVIKENDAIGQAVAAALVPTIEPKKGKSIYTSIDKKLQIMVEAKLKENVDRYNAEGGSIVIMDPKTGQIMALANYPTYDPNKRDNTDPNAYGNAAVSSPYEIGSVGKAMTLAAAVDMGVIVPTDVILPDGHQGCERISDDLDPICTWDSKPVAGPLTAEQCLVLSDNICFYHIAKMLDETKYHQYLQNFGVGSPSGIDLAGESYAPLKTVEEMTIGDVAAFSYGHGYSMTAIQAIDMIASIANYGVRMKPYVVTKVVDEDTGEEKTQEPTVIDQIITKKTSEVVANSMNKVFLDNIKYYESWYQDLKNYKIAMKSGSALVVENGVYSSDLDNTYVGFDMSSERKFVMLVNLMKPSDQQLSFYNARTMWLDTFSVIKDYLQVPRN